MVLLSSFIIISVEDAGQNCFRLSNFAVLFDIRSKLVIS